MPTEAQVKTFISDGVKIKEFLRTTGGTDATNLLGLMNTFKTDVGAAQGQFASFQLSGMDQVRRAFADAKDAGQAWFESALLEYAKVKDFPDTDPQLITRRLYQYMHDNTLRVLSRSFSFGSVALGGSNVGDGTINRLTKDENNYDIENTWAQVVSLRCIRDRNSGAVKHEEVFEIRGGEANVDNIVIAGSGNVSTVQCLSARTSLSYFQNPSFSLMNGAGSTKFDGWTITGTAADFTQDGTNYYRDFFGDSTPYSLKIASAGSIAQAFTVNNSQFDPTTPYFIQVALNKSVGSGSGGSIILTFGDQTATIALASMSAGWNLLKIGLSDDNWFKLFMGTAPTLKVEWDSASSGYILVDDIVIGPMQNFDGLWYAPVGGAVPFIVFDTATFTDTEDLTKGKIQRAFFDYEGLYLPATASTTSVTWSDPS